MQLLPCTLPKTNKPAIAGLFVYFVMEID